MKIEIIKNSPGRGRAFQNGYGIIIPLTDHALVFRCKYIWKD